MTDTARLLGLWALQRRDAGAVLLCQGGAHGFDRRCLLRTALHRPPRHVLVTGSSALIGIGVPAELRRRRSPSTSLNRSESNCVDYGRAVVGSAGDADVVADAIRDADAVIHLAAAPPPEVGPADEVFIG